MSSITNVGQHANNIVETIDQLRTDISDVGLHSGDQASVVTGPDGAMRIYVLDRASTASDDGVDHVATMSGEGMWISLGLWLSIHGSGGVRGLFGFEVFPDFPDFPPVVGDAVYVTSAGNMISKAMSDLFETTKVVGVVESIDLSAPSESQYTVLFSGEMGGYSGLVPGAQYYLSGDVSGAISLEPGRFPWRVGTAKDETTLVVDVEMFVPANVLDFRAVGDDSADDTAAFQAAIDAARFVYVPGLHTYLVSHVDLADDTYLYGDGPSSVIKRPDNALPSVAYALANALTIDILFGNLVKNVTIRDLTIDGNEANQSIIDDPQYRESTNAGAVGGANVYVIGDAGAGTSQRGSVCIRNVHSINATNNGLVVNNADEVIVEGCRVENTGKNGLYLAQVYGRNSRVVNNFFRECGWIYGGGIGLAQSGTVVSNNTVVSCYEMGIGATSTGNGKRAICELVIADNIVRGIRRRVLDNTGSRNSWVASSIGVGILWQQTQPLPSHRRCSVSITGNAVSGSMNVTETGAGTGISILGIADASPLYRPAGFVIANNVVMLTNSIGIDVRYLDNAVITGNSVRSPGFAGISMLDAKSSTCVGNSVQREWPFPDIVAYGGKEYTCIRRHVSESGSPPTTAVGDWTETSAVDSNTYEEWDADRAYAPAGTSTNIPTCYAFQLRIAGVTSGGIHSTNVVQNNAYEADGGSHICSVNLPVRVALPAVPDAGAWQLGARIDSTAVVVGTTLGWVCTTTGYACGTAWTINTAYLLGAVVHNAGNSYRCITAGTSAGAGGPTTLAADIVDNTVHWKYLAPRAAFTALPNL